MSDHVLKILVLDEFPGLGGAERVLLQIIDGAGADSRRSSRQFAVAIPGDGGFRSALERRGIQILLFPELAEKGRWLNPDYWRNVRNRFREILAKHTPDIILVNSVWCLCLLRTVRAACPVPIICGVHASVAPQKRSKRLLFQWIGSKILNFADRFVTVSSEMAVELKSLGVRPEKVTVIANGVDLDCFHRAGSRDTIRSKFEIPDEAVLVTAAGRIHPGKGQESVLEAARRVVKDHDRFRFIIAGEEIRTPDEDLNFTSRLKDLIARWGMNQAVTMPGFVDNLPDLLHGSDIFVSASREESFGLAVLEAMACGLPVVVSDVAGHGNLVEDGVSGFLIPTGDSNAMADALIRLGTDPELRREMGENGRKTACKYDLKTTVAAWLDLMEKMAGSLPRETAL